MIVRSTAAGASLGVLLAALAACGEDPGASQVEIHVSGDDVKVDGQAAPAETTQTADAPTAELASAPSDTPEAPPTSAVEEVAPGHLPLKYLIGRVDPASDPAFARIPDKYIKGSRVWGQKDAVAAFVKMAEAAEGNGYKLTIVSAFRSFDDQKQIWNDKWTGKTLVEKGKLPNTIPDPGKRALKILEFSSMPGTSRHHWGTDFDLNNLNNSYFNTKDGKRIYDWLTANAPGFGFCQVYSAKGPDRPTGYEEEKWHWSYTPVASWYLNQYPVDVGYERLTGFEGADAASTIDVIKTYVDGINPECK
jgi:zinc D-Ala-D-Ala carboxypeptidase